MLTGSRFDADRLALVGPAVPLVNGIISKGNNANVGVSSNGTLTYIPGSTVNYVSRFIWRARDGQVLGAAGPDKLEYPRYPRISPDGRKLVATVGPAQEGHIWVYDTDRRSTAVQNHVQLRTTPSRRGRRTVLVWRSSPHAMVRTRNLFVVPADGSIVEPSHLVQSDKDKTSVAWSRDGWLVYQRTRRLDADRPVEAARQRAMARASPGCRRRLPKTARCFRPTESGSRTCPMRPGAGRSLGPPVSRTWIAGPCVGRRRARPRLVARWQRAVLSGRLPS